MACYCATCSARRPTAAGRAAPRQWLLGGGSSRHDCSKRAARGRTQHARERPRKGPTALLLRALPALVRPARVAQQLRGSPPRPRLRLGLEPGRWRRTRWGTWCWAYSTAWCCCTTARHCGRGGAGRARQTPSTPPSSLRPAWHSPQTPLLHQASVSTSCRGEVQQPSRPSRAARARGALA